jgi:hypothetical protein
MSDTRKVLLYWAAATCLAVLCGLGIWSVGGVFSPQPAQNVEVKTARGRLKNTQVWRWPSGQVAGPRSATTATTRGDDSHAPPQEVAALPGFRPAGSRSAVCRMPRPGDRI